MYKIINEIKHQQSLITNKKLKLVFIFTIKLKYELSFLIFFFIVPFTLIKKKNEIYIFLNIYL
jgi:hypothetical protein